MQDAQLSLLDSPLGTLAAYWRERTLLQLRLPPDSALDSGAQVPAPAWLMDELDAYFQDPGHSISIQLLPSGTSFQQRVWQTLRGISSGSVLTYGELAARLNSSARAIGNACRANPVPIIVPCHRVVGTRGIGGFAGTTAGEGIGVKAWLLRHEGARWPGIDQ